MFAFGTMDSMRYCCFEETIPVVRQEPLCERCAVCRFQLLVWLDRLMCDHPDALRFSNTVNVYVVVVVVCVSLSMHLCASVCICVCVCVSVCMRTYMYV